MRATTFVLILTFLTVFSTTKEQELQFLNDPISTTSPSTFYESHENPWITPTDIYAYNERLIPPTNAWWQNMVLPGGTGFYALEVVELPSDVTDATKQISEVELISLGITASIGQVVQVTRDVFNPNNNQGSYYIQASPVGFRFSNTERFLNSSLEFTPLVDWSFQLSCKEGLKVNAASGPEGGSAANWPFKAIDWNENSVILQYAADITSASSSYLTSYQTRFSAYQTFEYNGSITPVISTVGVAHITTLTPLTTSTSSLHMSNNNNNDMFDMFDDNDDNDDDDEKKEEKKEKIEGEIVGYKVIMSDDSQWLILSSAPIDLQLTSYINYVVIPDGEPKPPNPLNYQYLYLSEASSLSPPLNPSGGAPQLGYEYLYHRSSSPPFNALHATSPFSGFISISKIPNSALSNPSVQSLLLSSSSLLPTSGDASIVQWTSSGEEKIGYYFNYTIWDVMTSGPSGGLALFALPPLLLANLTSSSSVSVYENTNLKGLLSNRGELTYVYASSLLFEIGGGEGGGGGGEGVMMTYFNHSVKIQSGVNAVSENDVSTLIEQLRYDSEWTNITTYYDSYIGGKELLCLAEITFFLASTLHDNGVISSSEIYEQIEDVLNRLKNAMSLWLADTSFIYDLSWGGIVDSWGLINQYSDYSNIMYQDHPFHYGYFIQSAAIIAHLDREYLPSSSTPWIDIISPKGVTYEELVNALIRDVANPSYDDVSFPQWRFFDWGFGFSRPMGMFPAGSGGNEESTAEDFNFFYSLYFWGQSTDNKQLETIGRVLSARVSAAASSYWQIGSSDTIYIGSETTAPTIPKQGINTWTVVGILWDIKADPNTWFLATDYCAVGIQTILRSPSMINELEDEDWRYRMVKYWTNPDVSSDNWHIWSIPPIEKKWYSILLPLIASIYPSAARTVWNDPRCGFDSGNSKGTILWNILYNQAAGPMIEGVYDPLTPPSNTPPPVSGFPLVCYDKYVILNSANGPIAAYQNDLNAQPSENDVIASIDHNCDVMKLNCDEFGTSASWQQQADAYLLQYNSFLSAYNQEISATSSMPPEDALLHWQQFARDWGLPVRESVQLIQAECTAYLDQLNHYYNLSIQNMNSMNTLSLIYSLEECLVLLDDLSDQLLYYSSPTYPPSTQADLTFWATEIVYSPYFGVTYPYLDETSTGKSCVQNFCNYSEAPVPPEYESTTTRSYSKEVFVSLLHPSSLFN